MVLSCYIRFSFKLLLHVSQTHIKEIVYRKIKSKIREEKGREKVIWTKEIRNFSFQVYLKQDPAQTEKSTQKPMQPDLQIPHSK